MYILNYIFCLSLLLNLLNCAPKPNFSINGVLQNLIGLSTLIGLKGSIFSGEITLTSSQTTVNLETRVVPLRTLVFCNFQYGGSELGYSSTCDIDEAGSSIVIQTGGFFQNSKVRYNLLEFNNDVSVLRRTIFYANFDSPKKIDLSVPILLENYLITSSARASGNFYDADDSALIMSKFLSSRQLELSRRGTRTNTELITQIIKIDNSKIQSGNSIILNGESASAASINSVNLEKTAIIFSLRPKSSVSRETDYMVRAKFINNSSVEFSRIGTSVELEISFFIIEFVGNERVQSGELLGVNSNSVNASLSSPLKDPSRSLLLFSNSTSPSNTPDEDKTVSSYLGNIIDANTIKFTRKESKNTNSNISYFIIEFP